MHKREEASISDEDVSEEDVSDEDVSDEDVSDEVVSEVDVSEVDVSEEDVTAGDGARLPQKTGNAVFRAGWPAYNRPGKIVTLGHYYPKEHAGTARDALKESKAGYHTEAPLRPHAMRQNLGWTQLINSLNAERQWPHKRLFELLDPMLEADIALAVVPPHMAYQAFWPLRTLVRQLAEHAGRIDATSCLVRHTTIRRITYGGPSTRLLHRQTIHLEHPALVAGRRVLLLDDIAKSGASLMACREILMEAGALTVQAMALGRVIIGGAEGG